MRALLMILTLALLAGCLPHQYHLGVSAGTLGFDRPVSDAETATVYAGVGWSPQQRAHERRMEDYALASLAANPRVDPVWLQDAMEEADAAEGEEASEHIPFLPDVPENEEERWNVLAYGAVALMLAGAAWIFSKRKGSG